MKKQYHILNGDSLKQHFPENIKGEIIITRECLVDGNVQGNNLDELFQSRAQFISTNYKSFTEQDYYKNTVPEFRKIQDISDDADINLWFEEDLFCQVNLWFTIHLLCQSEKNNLIFLIKPQKHSPYDFGGLDKSELISIYENRLLLSEINKLADLWVFYQNNNLAELLNTAVELENKYPFLLTAVNAHIERIPTNDNPGRPSQSLIKIMKDLNTEEFKTVFKEFNQRESIYGFGDLQVKRLFDEIINKL